MTADGFRIEDAALIRHAGSVTALAGRVRTAADAAQPLRRDAYGLIGQLFAAIVDETARTASQAVADVADVVRRHGEGVRVSQENYRTADRTLAALFREFR